MAETPAVIGTDDIRAAVASGLMDERSAAALTALAHSRRGARENLAPGDEPFELFKGFNEIFIMVGLSILASGWIGVAAWKINADLITWKSTLATICIVSAVFIWLLSEYFIRRRRMVGPAILLTIFFAGNAVFYFVQWRAQVFMLAQEDYSSLILPGFLSVAAVAVFWLRFKVPFAMAIIALGLFATALVIAATQAGVPRSVEDLFVLSGQGIYAWITLALGLATFAVAMLFDASDPHRVTRRSAQGFWLHLVASPMIINTIALTLIARETVAAQWQVLALMGLFAVVAVVIDRRSFLMAAIGYVVAVTLALNPIAEDVSFAALILALGLLLVLLGAFWARIRGALIAALPLGPIRPYLPPSH